MKTVWVITFFSVLVWSGVYPKDYLTWALEVAPAVIGVIVLAATRKSFPLTPLVYWLILIHCVVLMVGGHYTYAEVPLFESLKPVFGFGIFFKADLEKLKKETYRVLEKFLVEDAHRGKT